jgi:hypothetical protein
MNRTHWVNSNVLDSYSGSARFESRLGHRLSLQVFHGVPQSFQTNSDIATGLGHDCFLPNPVQFIIHLSPYHSTLYNLDTEGLVQ